MGIRRENIATETEGLAVGISSLKIMKETI